MSTNAAVCPVPHGERAGEAMGAGNQHHPEWSAQAQQAMLDQPEDTLDIVADLHGRLSDAYRYMATHNPAKAAETVSRRVRAAFEGARGHCILAREAELLHEVMPTDQHYNCRYDVDPSKPVERIEAYRRWLPYNRRLDSLAHQDVTDWYVDIEFHGQGKRFINTMTGLGRWAVHSLKTEDDGDLPAVYREISAYEPGVRRMMQMAGNLAPDGPFKALCESGFPLDGLIMDNVNLSYDVVVASTLELAKTGEAFDADGHGQMLRCQIDGAAALSSVKRAVSQALRRPAGSNGEYQDQFLPDGSDLQRLDAVGYYDDMGHFHYQHASLADGAWRRGNGNCPAQHPLRQRDAAVRQQLDAFFNSTGMLNLDSEAVSGTHILLLIASLVAEKTIFIATEDTPRRLLPALVPVSPAY